VLMPKLDSRIQYGFSTIEALVALVVLALGVMGLAGVQSRLLVEGRTSNSRAIAVSLVDNLADRLLLNREAAATTTNYVLDWSATPTAPKDCINVICSGTELAAWDLSKWKKDVSDRLPAGDAKIFKSSADPRQTGVMIAWAQNESKAAMGAASAAYLAPMNVDSGVTGVVCPMNMICHLVYVQTY
jgi:type IV pilus assembly protein PilV